MTDPAPRGLSLGSLLNDLANVPANVSEILRGVRKVLRNQEIQMALADDQRAAIDDLKAEDGAIIAALKDLAAKAAQTGSVSDTDVQASIDAIRAEIDRVHAEVTADDPGVVPAPTPPAPAGP
jgi:ACT domain-containing protein